MGTAAALAAGSIAFRDVDRGYASLLLERARMLYAFGEKCPGDYIVNGRHAVFLFLLSSCAMWWLARV